MNFNWLLLLFMLAILVSASFSDACIKRSNLQLLLNIKKHQPVTQNLVLKKG